MSECIFCKIIKSEIPCHKVYESDSVLAFLDIHPVSFGHTLVIPKSHYQDLLNTPPEVLTDLITVTQEIAPAILEATHTLAFNIGINTGKLAGQVIFHTHVHVIPRSGDDGLTMWGENSKAAEDLTGLAKQIKEKVV